MLNENVLVYIIFYTERTHCMLTFSYKLTLTALTMKPMIQL